MEENKLNFKKLSKYAKIILSVAVVLILTIVIIIIAFPTKDGSLTTVSQSSLEKVIEINELETIKYTYNAIATKHTDDNKSVKYYVAYDGTVTAGIDFKKINISVDNENKIVSITLPEVEIQGTEVKLESMEFIFTKDKYETETVSQEAYKLCKEDLRSRVEKEDTLYTMAKENAIMSVKGMFKPWIDTIDNSYTVEVK